MKKLFAYYMLLKWTKDPLVAARIYQLLYEGQMIEFGIAPVSQVKQTMTKKDELETSLAYLKAKPVKSSKDKESIQMIQAVLNNMN